LRINITTYVLSNVIESLVEPRHANPYDLRVNLV